jgi:CRP-like cAMP-binding protein
LAKTPITGDANIFRRQALFSSCEPAFLDELAKILHRKFFFAGQKVVREGTESNEMHGIYQGHAVVERRGQTIGEIESGQCFGEMAVMGITTSQTVTVRAETLCDMQVLGRWDLEELMKGNRQERKRVLRVMASMMREDLADVTNLEILSEIPLFHDADHKLLQSLEQASEVELARKEELVLNQGEANMFVLLQGMARVESCGITLRNLSEGDNFNAVNVLGEKCNTTIQVRAISVCLTLMFSRQALDESASKHSKGHRFLQAVRKEVAPDNGSEIRTQAALECSLFQHLHFTEEQCMQMIDKCEAAVVMPEEPVLHDDSEVLIFVLSGKLSIVSGMDTIKLGRGSSYGELSADNSGGVPPTVTAEAASSILFLWRPAFMSVLDSWSPEQKAQVLAMLEAIPVRQRDASDSGTSLRTRTDWLASSYIKAVSMSLRVKVGSKSQKVANTKKLLWKAVKSAKIIKEIANLPKKDQAEKVQEVVPEKSKTQLEKERQEHLLKQDLHRLTAAAKQACEEARQEQARLRSYADTLRMQVNALEQDHETAASPHVDLSETPLPKLSRQTNGESVPVLEVSEFVAMRQQNAALERRVQQLREKLEQAYEQRGELLNELRSPGSRFI